MVAPLTWSISTNNFIDTNSLVITASGDFDLSGGDNGLTYVFDLNSFEFDYSDLTNRHINIDFAHQSANNYIATKNEMDSELAIKILTFEFLFTAFMPY